MKSKAKRYDEGGYLRDSSGSIVRSGSGEPVRTRFGKSEDKEDKYDLESVGGASRRARTIEEQIGRKKEDSEESPRRKIEDYSKPSEKDDGKTGIAAGFRAEAPEPSSAVEKKTSTPAPVKKAMKVAEEKTTPASSKMTSARDTMEKGRAGEVESNKVPQTSKRMTVEEARQKAKEMTSKKKGPTEEQKESGRKFSEEKLKKQKESFESTPISKFFKKFSESPKETAERRAKEIRGYKSGGSVGSASKRADGIAQRGKTRGRMV